MTIINAVARLRATIVEAVSTTRKDAVDFLVSSTTSDTLFNHYILVHEFSDKQEINHWKKECRNLLVKLLNKTTLKSGVLRKQDYINVLWGHHAETAEDCKRHAAQILINEGLNSKEIKRLLSLMDFKLISLNYRFWLSCWYDYYHNPHATNKNTLPANLF